MAEESGGKSASQTIEFLKLFQQIGRSFLGLFLIEIGWTTFLVLATKLAGSEKGGPPAVGDLSFLRLWIYGALILVVFWGIYSRLIYYIAAPVLIVLKVCSDVFFFIIALIFVVLDTLLLPFVRFIRKGLIRRQHRVGKNAWIDKNARGKPSAEAASMYDAWVRRQKELIGANLRVDKDAWLKEFNERQSKLRGAKQDPELAFAAWESSERRKYADRIFEEVAADRVLLKENNLERLAQLMGKVFLTRLHSGLVVGVAPLVRYSDGKDVVVDHAPLQQFGDAIAAARVRLSELRGIGYIAVRPLPSLFRVETHGRARFARWFFKLDALIWGRYGQREEQLAQAHVVAAVPRISRDGDNAGLQYQRAIFPADIDDDFLADVSSFALAVDDPLCAHIAICLGILKALVRRHEKGRPVWLAGWDQSYRSSNVDARRVLIHLAFEILPLVSQVEAGASPRVLPTAAEVLSTIVSRWAGFQIGCLFRMEEEDRGLTNNANLFAPQLHDIITKCAELTPDDALHYYRLGAVSCLAGETGRALQEFRKAAALERGNQRLRPIPAAVYANVTLGEGGGGYGVEQDLVLARFAAHAACAIYSGAGHLVREGMEKSRLIRERTDYVDTVDPVIALVRKLFAEVDGLEAWKLPPIPAVAGA